jgi:hypothetical protein
LDNECGALPFEGQNGIIRHDGSTGQVADAQLRGTLDQSKARFAEMGSKLRVFSPDLFAQVEHAFLNKKARGFAAGAHSGDVVFRHGVWAPAGQISADPDCFRFEKKGNAWEGRIGEQSIRILEACDEDDAGRWIESYLTLANGLEGDSRSAILLLKGATFVLGEHDDNPTAVAGADMKSVRFFNHHSTQHLFCVGVEQCTVGWTFPTTALNMIVHESAHLFRKKLRPSVGKMASLAYEAMCGVKSSGNELLGIGNEINEGYLSDLIIGGIQKVCIDEPLAKYGRFELESVRLDMSNRLGGEVVAEAFGRFVIGGENPPKELSLPARSLMDLLRSLALEPVQLVSDYDPVITKTLAPMRLEEVLANAAAGRSMSL